MFQNNVKVLTFCRLVGIVDGHIPSAGWRFFLHLLRCIKTLQEDAWQGLMQVCHHTLCLVWLSAPHEHYAETHQNRAQSVCRTVAHMRCGLLT